MKISPGFTKVAVPDGAHFFARAVRCDCCHTLLEGTGGTPQDAETRTLELAKNHICPIKPEENLEKP